MSKQDTWDVGEQIYDKFVRKISKHLNHTTPRTQTLELLVALKQSNELHLLYREMLKELLNNFDDREVALIDGKLYEKVENYELLGDEL